MRWQPARASRKSTSAFQAALLPKQVRKVVDGDKRVVVQPPVDAALSGKRLAVERLPQ